MPEKPRWIVKEEGNLLYHAVAAAVMFSGADAAERAPQCEQSKGGRPARRGLTVVSALTLSAQ
jgi:hypothetical protein